MYPSAAGQQPPRQPLHAGGAATQDAVHDTPAEFSEKDFLGICNLDADLPNEFVTIVLKLLETHRSIHISCDHFQDPWAEAPAQRTGCGAASDRRDVRDIVG